MSIYIPSLLSFFLSPFGSSYLIIVPLRVCPNKPLRSIPFVCTLLPVDNPVLCDAGLADLTVALEVNHAKVYGVGSDCPTTTSTPLIETTSPPLLPTLLLAAASGGNVSFAATLE